MSSTLYEARKGLQDRGSFARFAHTQMNDDPSGEVKAPDVGAHSRPEKQKTEVEEIQQELQSALNIHSRVVRKRGFTASTAVSDGPAVQTAAMDPNLVSAG